MENLEFLEFHRMLIRLYLSKSRDFQPRILNSREVVFVQKKTDKIIYFFNGEFYELTSQELKELDEGTHKTQASFWFPGEAEFR